MPWPAGGNDKAWLTCWHVSRGRWVLCDCKPWTSCIVDLQGVGLDAEGVPSRESWCDPFPSVLAKGLSLLSGSDPSSVTG